MKLKRKADMNAPGTLGTILIVLVVVVLVVIIFRGRAETAAKTFDSLEINSKNKLCEALGKQLAERGTLAETIELSQGDGFPDDCDICLGGDNREVSNSYGIPTKCYSDPAQDKKIKTYKDMCTKSGCYISSTDQCCIGEAISRCGPECKK